MKKSNTIASTYITNLGKYNEGYLLGEWLDLPATEEEIQAALKRIGIDGIRYEEYFFTDWESEFLTYPGEYFNLEEINELCERIADCDIDPEILKALTSYNYDLESILDGNIEYFYFKADSMADVAEQYADEVGLLDSIPEHLRFYFDFEKFGRDIELEGNWIPTGSGYIEVLN